MVATVSGTGAAERGQPSVRQAASHVSHTPRCEVVLPEPGGGCKARAGVFHAASDRAVRMSAQVIAAYADGTPHGAAFYLKAWARSEQRDTAQTCSQARKTIPGRAAIKENSKEISIMQEYVCQSLGGGCASQECTA